MSSTSECIFCRIVGGEIKAEVLYEDEVLLVIKDIHPQAPVHFLAIPKKHYSSLDEVPIEEKALLGALVYQLKLIAQEQGLVMSGYRLVINNGKDAGQEVAHLHIHLLGGASLGKIA